MSRSWIPVTVLVIIIFSVFGYMLFGDKINSNVRSPAQPLPGCVEMQNNGNYENSIDIVFLADNFEDVEKFREVTDEMVGVFFETIPYNEYKDRFNFFRIEELNNNYNCDYNYGGDAIVCEPIDIKRAAVSCPNDYPIVAVDVGGIQKLFQHLRSSAWMGTASLNIDDDPLVFTHEFAHLFADFADEYEYGGNINWDAPNCDIDLNSCSKFDLVSFHDCVKGCVDDKHARSIEVGIMRDYWKSNVFGNYNEEVLRRVIEGESSSLEGLEVLKSPINLVELQYSSGEWDIISVSESIGFADNSFGTGDYIEVIGPDGESLDKVVLKSPILFLDGHDEVGNPVQSASIVEGAKYIVSLPAGGEKIVVKSEGATVSAYNLVSGEKIVGSSGFGGEIVDIPVVF
jgi:hypothetical protein